MTPPLYKKQGRRYVPAPELEHLTHFDPHMLLIGATRYYMGRMTIAACCFAEYELAKAWPHIPANTRAIIARDLEEEFRRDDEARLEGTPYLPLGMDCDRQAWEKVRALWAGEQPPAQPCEMSSKELAYRMKWLAVEMDTVGSAMVRAGQEMEGFDLQDAAEALRASIKDKT